MLGRVGSEYGGVRYVSVWQASYVTVGRVGIWCGLAGMVSWGMLVCGLERFVLAGMVRYGDIWLGGVSCGTARQANERKVI